MSDVLSQWLREDRDRYVDLRNDIDDLVDQVLPTLIENSEAGLWQYELPAPKPHSTPKSQSTPAMCAYSLAVLGKQLPYAISWLPIDAFGEDYLDRYMQADHDLVKDPRVVLAEAADALDRLLMEGGALQLSSETFGDDDPLTLYYALSFLGQDKNAQSAHPLVKRAGERVVEVAKNPVAPVLRSKKWEPGQADEDAEPFPHSMPQAYVYRLAHLLTTRLGQPIVGDQADLTSAHEYLRTEFLKQLAFSELQHAEFDVGHFVFALEGQALIDPEAITGEQVQRALDVVSGAQGSSPGLWPLRPFRRDPKGGVNLPVSIEVATSLLLVSIWLDYKRPRLRVFERCLGILRTYLDWLRSQLARVSDYWGWHSEHFWAREPMVNTWYTALALVFLAALSAAIERFVAMEALRIGRFHQPERYPQDWESHKDQEPMIGSGGGDPGQSYLVYENVEASFLQARSGVGEPSYSMLLYGPPGTGKTTLAKRLAESLEWGFVVVSPSDFIAGGPAEVEARAKDIFEALGLQTKTVIFFDELDRLLLDRGSAAYERQADMFQFMTPSMLTKINDLRQAERNIICIATNYAWRIDPAITRRGRVDEHYLLLPPNAAQRRSILRGRVGREYQRVSQPTPKPLRLGRAVQKTALFTYGELKGTVRQAVLREPADARALVDAILTEADVATPTIRLSTYEREADRLREAGEAELPPALIEEYLMLQWLRLEAEPKAGQSFVPEGTMGSQLHDRKEALRVIRDKHIRERLDEMWAN